MQENERGFTECISIVLVLLAVQLAGAEDLNSTVIGQPRHAVTSALSIDLSPSKLVSQSRVFDTPLVATHTPPDAESLALIGALENFKQRSVRDDFSSFERFTRDFPDSAWSISLRSILGGEYYRTGHFTKAIDSWKSAWDRSKAITNEVSTAVGSQAVGELALMYARLGRMRDIRQLLAELDGRHFPSAGSRSLLGARDGLWSMEHQPEASFRCGPLALDRICAATDRAKAGNQLIQDSRSSTNGFSARQVAELSRRLGMNYQVAFREPGAGIILPAVVHWKVGHYAALIARDGALLRAEDPTFRNKTWLSDATLDEEASGYFLVRSGPLPSGWRRVPDEEADRVWGKGTTNISDPDSTTPYDLTAKPPDSCHGMASWNVHLLLASQIIQDTPVGYAPPVGPPIFFTVTYNSANAQGLEGPDYSNISPDWRCNWLAYITDDPMNPAGDIRFTVDGGGTLTFTDYNPTNQVFQNLMRNRANLARTSTNSYELRYPDGSKKIFDLPAASAGTLRKIYMTAVVDPAGNAATIQFDYPGRITGITDALGQQTRLYYEVSDTSVVPQWQWVQTYIITRVVDPFGRTARFQPSAAVFAHLTNIVDCLGLSSSFVDTAKTNVGWWISDLTTPYGTTHFVADAYKQITRANWMEITNPDGTKERVEYNEGASGILSSDPLAIVPKGMPVRNFILWARNTFYWDRKAYAESFSQNFLGYTHAKIFHFTHGGDYNSASPVLESYKAPYESRVWFNYEGQVNPTFIGTSDRPIRIARVLEDGTTQLRRFEYNSVGNLTKAVDPLGRTFSFLYDTNGVDLVEVRQTRGSQNELLFRATYGAGHLLLKATDASGQNTVYTYNARGQVLTVTNPQGGTTALAYDAMGYLVSIDGPLPGTSDTSHFAYDAFGRLRSATDAEGYTLLWDYDVMDRPTRVSYPDGTSETVTYNRLDPEIVTDRAGRQTTLTHDSLRQLVTIQDALGRVTRYDWCGCGALNAMIDTLGRTTTWQRDVQGRITAKIYADGSQEGYEYDQESRLKTIRDEKGQLTEFRYNIDDTLQQKSYRNAQISTPSVHYTYDSNYSRLSSMADGSGLTTYAYCPVTNTPAPGAGQLASIDGPLINDVITFGYDSLGRMTSRTINGVGIMRNWDALGRLTQLTNSLGAFSYAWEGLSFRLAAINLPNGQRTTFSYYGNQKDRLLQEITHFKPDSTVQSHFAYDYNALHQITSWIGSQNGITRTWTPSYDGAERLNGVTETGGLARAFAYTYDNMENRLTEQSAGLIREANYNSLNQLTHVSNGASVAIACEWDAENCLVAVNRGQHRTEFTYDGLDRRTRVVEKENGGVISDRRFVWYGSVVCEERDSTGTVVTKRFSGHGVRAEGAADLPPGNYFYARDHLESIREVTDVSGQVRASYDYDPYGRRTRAAGDLDSDFGFTGHFFHAASGFYLAPYRGYDPDLGRWLSRDPIGERGGLNLYAYALNDPVNYLDPLGLQTKADSLVQNLDGYKSVKAGVDAYNTAKTGLETFDKLTDKGLKDVVLEKAEGKAKETIKKFNASEEYKNALENTAKTADASGKSYAVPLSSKYGTAGDALIGKDPCSPPSPSQKNPPPPDEPGFFESAWDYFFGPSKPTPAPKEFSSGKNFNPSGGY